MSAVRRGFPLPLVLAGLLACDGALRSGGAPEAGTRPASVPAAGAGADTGFAALVAALSEPGRYFDTDNLISNESSYLHVLGDLEARGVEGGAYIGVGPDQNFSYMAAVRPAMAFIVDIRRDNLLQHLWFRALFEASSSRLDYLCLMLVRRCGGPSGSLSAAALVARVDRAEPATEPAAVMEAVLRRAAAYGVPLDASDRETVRRIHGRFAAAGLDLRFNTHGRTPRSYYPTLRGLLLETDRSGRQASYLADEGSYAFIRDMQAAGRVVPVVGDLGGPHALRAIGSVVRRRGEAVSAFYVSNVEYYLFGDGNFDGFVRNLEGLPAEEESVLIRSVFRTPIPMPDALPGHASTQVLHAIPALLDAWERGRIRSYGDLLEAGLSASRPSTAG
ncbi:MAG TPA: hypothetical protein VMM12_14315 [Longimicrobiales bacterium]|nr:hypothetical protein [Longimicrobiales bacterium]